MVTDDRRLFARLGKIEGALCHARAWWNGGFAVRVFRPW
jgi:hypothetical protein